MARSRRSAKAAGTAFETLVSRYLAAALNDDRIERRARTGGKDRGDVGGVRVHGQRLVIEAKNCSKQALPQWVNEAHTEAGNDDALVGIVVAKRHGVGDPARQWVHMELGDFVKLITGQPLAQEESA